MKQRYFNQSSSHFNVGKVGVWDAVQNHLIYSNRITSLNLPLYVMRDALNPASGKDENDRKFSIVDLSNFS